MTPYEIGSLVIGAVGAVATFSAVIVALWQTKYANRKRLKCRFIENNTVCSANFSQHKSYVGMDITNIGNKKVIVNSWGIKTKNKFLLILTDIEQIDNSDRFDKAVSVKTPYSLDVEQNITFFYAKDLFSEQIKKLIDSGEIQKDKPVQFIVRDSTGKKYKVKSKKPAKTYLN